MSKYFLLIAVMLFIGAFILELCGHHDAAFYPVFFGFVITVSTGLAVIIGTNGY